MFFSWPKAILFLTPLVMNLLVSLVVPFVVAPLDRAAGETNGLGEGVYLGDGVPAENAGLVLAGLGVLCEVLGETSGPSTL